MNKMSKTDNKLGLKITSPYIIWSGLFIVIPLFLIIFFAFTKSDNGTYSFTLNNFKELMQPMYFRIFYRSIRLALMSTILCLLIGYPAAYIIAKSKARRQSVLLMLVIVPMWMNFLLRTYAWSAILGRKNDCVCACLIFISENRGDDDAHDQRNQQEYRWEVTGQQRFPSVRIIVCDRVRYFCIQL